MLETFRLLALMLSVALLILSIRDKSWKGCWLWLIVSLVIAGSI